MLTAAVSGGSSFVRCLMPGVRVYLSSSPVAVDPFAAPGLFRGEECFDGSLKGWRRWQKPSPEPKPDPGLKRIIMQMMRDQAGALCALHDRLLEKILKAVPAAQPIVFVSILRAGVFIARGLSERMRRHGYAEAPVTALGLFHEAGFDRSAFAAILKDYPGCFPVFVDGWTGRGVVAGELKKAYAGWKKDSGEKGLPDTPLLATLVDPGRHGDLYGTDRDTPVPCAHFTAPEVFGFSRAFIKNQIEMWSAYTYPEKYYDRELVNAWLDVFAAREMSVVPGANGRQELSALLEETAGLTNTRPEQWKVNVNEVVRSFVNRNPRELVLGVSAEESSRRLPDLVYLAGRTGMTVRYLPDWGSRHNCLAAVRVK